MEDTCSSETLVDFKRITLHYIPEYIILYLFCLHLCVLRRQIHYCNIALPITGVARSKAWNVFARLNTGTVGLSPIEDMDV
jgi:hypothetical protein